MLSAAHPAPPLLQFEKGRFAPQVGGDYIVKEGIGGGNRIRVAGDLLDFLRSGGAFPETDKPESGYLQRARRSSSSSGTWSRRRMSMLYARESWSSQT